MKKYRLHFMYLILIVALAVASRLKTNELYDQIAVLQEQVSKTQEQAEAARVEAERALAKCEGHE